MGLNLKKCTVFLTILTAWITTGCIGSDGLKDRFLSTSLRSVVTLALESCTQAPSPTAMQTQLFFDTRNADIDGKRGRSISAGGTGPVKVHTVRVDDATPADSTDNDLSFLTSFILQPTLRANLPGLVSLAPTPSPWLPPIQLPVPNIDIYLESFISGLFSTPSGGDPPPGILPMKLSWGLDCSRALVLRGNPPSLISLTVTLDAVLTDRPFTGL